MTMTNTRHGIERIRKRVGVSKKTVERSVQRVLLLGKPKEFYEGSLYRYLKKVEDDIPQRNNDEKLLVYGTHLYLLAGSRLITTWAIPSKYLRKRPPKEYEYLFEEVSHDEEAV
jgi:hypothetical protein